MRTTFKTVLGVAALALNAQSLAGAPAWAEDAAVKAELAEMRRAFTLDGKPPPPEILRDMGDGDLADSDAIWVTVDVKAAIGSNLYFDDVVARNGWVSQKKPNVSLNGAEEAA